jgi:Protein of unknown function (DUF4236)
MPIRFRRTFKIFPGVKINVSKGGISVTAGVRGAKLNFSRHGVRQTLGLPGSGLSETSYLFKNDSKSDQERDKDNDNDRVRERERNQNARTLNVRNKRKVGRWGASPLVVSWCWHWQRSWLTTSGSFQIIS